MLRSCLVWYLAAAMFVIGIAPRVDAAFAPSEGLGLSRMDRAGDLEKIRAALEQKVVAQRLSDLGYSGEEIMARLSALSDSQIHSLAQRIDQVKTGGEVGLIIGLLLIVLLVIVIIRLLGHRVIVR